MLTFLKPFVDIVLWRKGPQDLPASAMLLLLTLAAYVAVSALQLLAAGESGRHVLLYLVVDPLLLLGLIWVVLAMFRRRERFAQTASAVLGAATLLSLLLALPLQLVAGGRAAAEPGPLAALFALLLLVVFVLVISRIVRLATDGNLFAGLAVVITYVLLMESLAAALRPAGS